MELFSDIGPDGHERRQVECFRDGRLGWIDEEKRGGRDRIGRSTHRWTRSTHCIDRHRGTVHRL
ncbi:MAG: hypothetical protein WBA97_21960 [Actinophytocola sp.]|uniref:hypothetical protein n=1 Tax=Actinophytocola sp. TaxID=1872138 RepID=UPI003C76724C